MPEIRDCLMASADDYGMITEITTFPTRKDTNAILGGWSNGLPDDHPCRSIPVRTGPVRLRSLLASLSVESGTSNVPIWLSMRVKR